MAFSFAITQVGDKDGSVITVAWTGGATGDSGTGWQMPEWADCCVQVKGTIGGGTVTVEGSNDGTNWDTLNNAQGTALSFTALTSSTKQIVERPLYIRPSVTGGTASAISVVICARRANPLRT